MINYLIENEVWEKFPERFEYIPCGREITCDLIHIKSEQIDDKLEWLAEYAVDDSGFKDFIKNNRMILQVNYE